MSKTEICRLVLQWFFLSGIITYLFYENIYVYVAAMPFVIVYIKLRKNDLKSEKKKILQMQFKELCISVSSSLAAGVSLSNAIRESFKEMRGMFGETSMICHELKYVIKRIDMNMRIEEAFGRFAQRSGIEEILIFSEILNISVESGGDMIRIIKDTATEIGKKLDVEREIQSILSAKRYEQRIMNVVPLMMILYMKVTSADTMAVMYNTCLGRIIMTLCLIVYAAAYLTGKYLIRIEV